MSAPEPTRLSYFELLGAVQASKNVCRHKSLENGRLLHFSSALASRTIPVRTRSGGGDGTDGGKGII